MKVFDLSHPISPSMPYYPGTDPPTFQTFCTIEKDGFTEKKISLMTHTGTHLDAPAHILNSAPTLDGLAMENFCGRGMVLDFSNLGKSTIEPSDLEPHRPVIETRDFILIHTGWSQFWGHEEYYLNYPTLSVEGARWICQTKPKGIGVDTISVDPTGIDHFPVHKELLSNGLVIVENLTNLDKIAINDFFFCSFPLRIIEADGSPVRAVAITGLHKMNHSIIK